ncbi:MAG TPA: hypothetical protein VIU12_11245 [Chryseolinea sp.]
MDITTGKKRIAILWLGFAAILFAILLVFTANQRFDSHNNEAWGWYSQNIVPSLFLIVTVLVKSAKATADTTEIDPFYFKLSFILSLFYLLLLMGVLVYSPMPHGDGGPSPIQFLTQSNLFLGIVQGIVTSCLGIFYVK